MNRKIQVNYEKSIGDVGRFGLTMMKRRDYLILFILGLVVSFVAARLQPVPGYMDAEYYYAGAIRLHEGYGFTQPFLWNYLDGPVGLPHPSHTYWMPLASFLGAVGMRIASSSDFFSARLVFICLSALLPPLTAWLSMNLIGKRRSAMLSGLLALFPGYYLVYTTNTENFTLYMLFGTLFLYTALVNKSARFGLLRFLVLGIVAGFMHLSRADGMLWLLVTPVVVWVWVKRQGVMSTQAWLTAGKMMGLVGIGYVLVMAPWFWRNIQAFDGLFPPGGSQTLWLTDYNQTYIYPPERLTISHWLSAGWQQILSSRWHAFTMNLKTALAVQGEVFLLPLVMIGLWHLRHLAVVRLVVLMWLVTLGVMTVVFPYAGWRGGFLHSGAALQPFWWAVAPVGFDAFLSWGVRVRNWNVTTSRRVFSTALIGMSLMLSVALFYQNVYGADPGSMVWRMGFDRYSVIGKTLPAMGVEPTDVLMVNNPPGLYVATRWSSLAVPDGTEETVVTVAQRFGAAYFLLDENHPAGLAKLYFEPKNVPGLTYLNTIDGTHIFRVD
jgi:hypothetical protein